MTKYYTLDGQVIAEGEQLPQQFIHVFNGTALMWDFAGEEAKSSLVSSELLAIVLGTKKVQPMNTLSYLSEVHENLWREGDTMMSEAISRKPYNTQAQESFKKGLAFARRANSLWPLIHLYRAHERSYWALRRLALRGPACAYCDYPVSEIFELSWCTVCELCYQKHGLHRF